MKTLPADYILRKHNLEVYLTKKIEPKVPFLSMFPTSDNDTGEFATVIESATAKEDMDNGVLSEPLETTEGSMLTDVEVSPINAILGKTMAVGYQFRYTKQFLKRQDSDSRIMLALSKIIAGMAHKINAIVLNGLVDSAGADFPQDLSDWVQNPDIRSDAIKLRAAFESGEDLDEDLPFELNTAFISNDRHVLLQDYYMSFQWPFNNKSMDVDGTYFNNIRNAFNGIPNTNIVGFDSTIPPGIIEKYVDPDFSVIKSAELKDPQNDMGLPGSLINVNHVPPRKFEEPYIYQVVAELGYSSQEPRGVLAGEI